MNKTQNMPSKINYSYWGKTKDGNKFHDYYQTKSTRQNKVLKQIEQELLKKHKLTFLHLDDFGFKAERL